MTRARRAPRAAPVRPDRGGRLRGKPVPARPVAASLVRPARRGIGWGSPRLIFGVAALVLVAGFVLGAHLLALPLLPALFVGVNGATLLLYGYDKAIAGRGRLRIPESVLHSLALLGGTPAALLAQRWFRHKVSKASFQRVFVVTAVVQVALVTGWVWWTKIR